MFSCLKTKNFHLTVCQWLKYPGSAHSPLHDNGCVPEVDDCIVAGTTKLVEVRPAGSNWRFAQYEYRGQCLINLTLV